jgi:hypothetical protein
MTSKIAVGLAVVLGSASAALARTPVPAEPYGTAAQQEQCVANMQARLHGNSILGPRGTSIYIQDRANLESNGMTEYDVMVSRCMQKLYRQYTTAHGRR